MTEVPLVPDHHVGVEGRLREIDHARDQYLNLAAYRGKCYNPSCGCWAAFVANGVKPGGGE